MRSRLHRSTSLILGFLIATAMVPVLAGDAYTPTIPPGYSGKVVLHVDYGDTLDKMGVEWGEGYVEYREPASARSMRVVRDRFYFVDAAARRIKQYRSPGTLVWASEPFENLGYYAVAPDLRVFLIWGAGLGRLSCLDTQGKLVWTKERNDVLPRQMLKDFGLPFTLPGLDHLEWTDHWGWTLSLVGSDQNGRQREVIPVVNGDGIADRLLPGRLVGSDGLVYDFREPNRRAEGLTVQMVGRDLAGNTVRSVTPDFAADDGVHLAGHAGICRRQADPTGGFIIESSAWLPASVRLTSRLETKLEQVLWRFDLQGNLKEQWRFPSNKFASGAFQALVAADGSVYYLRFGETGIDVVKYSRTAGNGGEER